jgi:hypothetical protein
MSETINKIDITGLAITSEQELLPSISTSADLVEVETEKKIKKQTKK